MASRISGQGIRMRRLSKGVLEVLRHPNGQVVITEEVR